MSAGLLGVCQLSRLTYSRKQSKPSWVSWVSSACVIATNRVRSSRRCSSAGAGEGSDAATAGHGRRGRRSSAVLCMGMHGAAFGLAFTISNVAAAAFGSWSIARKNESHCCKRAAQMVPCEPHGTPRGTVSRAASGSTGAPTWPEDQAVHPPDSPTRTQRAQAPSERAWPQQRPGGAQGEAGGERCTLYHRTCTGARCML
jgi:hypothetical protein